MKRLLLIILTLFIYGCISQSDVPIRSVTGDKFDSRLAGAWVLNEEDNDVYLHLGKTGDEGKIVMIEHQEDRMIVDESSIVTACLSNGCFLSIYIDTKDAPGYLLLKYDLSESKLLTLQEASNKFLKSAIESGKIRGVYNDKGMFPVVDLHATESELRDFVVKYGDKLFTGDKAHFIRLDR